MHSLETSPVSALGEGASLLFHAHPIPMWIYERDSLRFIDVNDAAVQAYGYQRDEFLALTIAAIRPEEDLDKLQAALAVPRDGWRKSGIWRHRTKGGSIFHVEVTSQDCLIGDTRCVVVAASDVTQGVRAELAAREAESRLNEAQRLASMGSWHWDTTTDVVTWSDELFRIWQRDPGTGAPDFTTQRDVYCDSAFDDLTRLTTRAVETGEPYEIVVRIRRADGEKRWISCRAAASRDADGRIDGLYGTVHDITQQRLAYEAVSESEARLRAANERLERSERRYRDLVENLNDIVWSTDMNGIITYLSRNAANYGYQVESLLGQPYATIVHPDDLDGIGEARRHALTGSPARCEYRAYDGTGAMHYVRSSFRAVFDDQGQPTGFNGVLSDITEQRRAEEQLRAAQRLEAVGRLAGGVAHDFNNLLVVIKGYAELALERLPPGDPLRSDLQEILNAGERASSLTQHLLAFSRKQVLRPTVTDLNQVVRGMAAMFSRVIGEDIRLQTALELDLPPVLIDTAQIEHAILNLVVNARDAMPSGGQLLIRTRSDDGSSGEASPVCPCVVLSVEDTGHGMDDATRARIFEPFFTTKPTGQGTGLGLPMVYGFVKQSGGSIDVQSELGIGTQIRIRLPQHLADGLAAAPAEPTRVQRGRERILIVEDEDSVRQLVERVLTAAGYEPIAAATPNAAIAILAKPDCRIELLLTDVVMPEMTGAELAQRATQMRPDLKVLYMTGYRNVPASAQARMDEHAQTIGKPFTSAELTGAIRQVLEEPR